MRRFLPILYLLVTLVFAGSHTSVHAIASVRVESISFECAPFRMGYVIVATGDILDYAPGWDMLYYIVHDGEGNELIWDWFGIPITGGEYAVDWMRLLENTYFPEPRANPITFSFFEINEHRELGPFLGSASFNSPCIEEQGVDREQAAGIERLFQDGIVIARQPDGGLDFYMPDGCLLGKASVQILRGADLGDRGIIHSIEGCNGFRADIWSLGYPYCQLQVNMYGPAGYDKVHTMERDTSNPTCKPSEVSESPENTTSSTHVQQPGTTTTLSEPSFEEALAGEISLQILAGLANAVLGVFGSLVESVTAGMDIIEASEISEDLRDIDYLAAYIDLQYNAEGNEAFQQNVDEALAILYATWSDSRTWKDLSAAEKRSEVVIDAIQQRFGPSYWTISRFFYFWRVERPDIDPTAYWNEMD